MYASNEKKAPSTACVVLLFRSGTVKSDFSVSLSPFLTHRHKMNKELDNNQYTRKNNFSQHYYLSQANLDETSTG